MNQLITLAKHIPIHDAVPVFTIAPLTLQAPERGIDLEIKVSAPVTGEDLPIVLLSHGHGPSLYIPSMDGYGPLANFWAMHGFVVIQPTHLNAKKYALGADSFGAPLFWRSRVEDMSRILDRIEFIEESIPLLRGRLNKSKIAVAGHSLGGQTSGMLLGARLTDPNDESATDVNLMDTRVKAGVLLATPGNGGADLNEFAAEKYSCLNPDFSPMSTPTLVVAGSMDVPTHLTVRGADWYRDPYTYSPGKKALLTVFGARHGLGGIAGYDAKETMDEDPDRLATVQRLTWAYLTSEFDQRSSAWSDACTALSEKAASLGQIEQKYPSLHGPQIELGG